MDVDGTFLFVATIGSWSQLADEETKLCDFSGWTGGIYLFKNILFHELKLLHPGRGGHLDREGVVLELERLGLPRDLVTNGFFPEGFHVRRQGIDKYFVLPQGLGKKITDPFKSVHLFFQSTSCAHAVFFS